MAEPGDLPPRSDPGDDHDDDLIGFASPASLQGRLRTPEPEPLPAYETEPAPEPEPQPEPEPPLAARDHDLFDDVREEPLPPEPPPVEAASVFAPSREFSSRRRRRDAGAVLPGGGMGLYAVYALILFAVPTMGVSALIGLFAVTGRAGPEDDLSSSHFIYQQRTLWAGAVAAVAGLILLAAPFALGVPILFALAIWLVLRGASGVWTLKSGRAIADPRGWWI